MRRLSISFVGWVDRDRRLRFAEAAVARQLVPAPGEEG